jgi:hypothetical protein
MPQVLLLEEHDNIFFGDSLEYSAKCNSDTVSNTSLSDYAIPDALPRTSVNCNYHGEVLVEGESLKEYV